MALSLQEIRKKIITLRNSGALFDLNEEYSVDSFATGFDRFSMIIHRLQNKKRILDIGSGFGLLIALFHEFGHECYAVDIIDYARKFPNIYQKRQIECQFCNVEVDPLPFPDNYFDGVTCCQVLEHFTHSHLPAVKEMHRVLKPSGLLEIDVPNAVCFRNYSRMLRGKHITWDYKKHYLHEEPVIYKGMSFFPNRHNREFVKQEMIDLLNESGFRKIHVQHIKSRRYRIGIQRIQDIGSAIRDVIPSIRKTLMGFGEK